MKLIKKIILFVVVIGVFGVSFYAYMGGFREVEVKETNFGTVEIFIYTHKGPYKNLNESWDQFQKEWESIGLTECNSLAIYLDGPETPEDKLRSVLGCRMDGLSDVQIKSIKSKLKTFLIPEMKCITATFPFKNFLSYFIAPTKVYPKFQKTLSESSAKTSVAIEVYGGSSNFVDHIDFFMPIEVSREVFAPLESLF
ncbi:GyrI-like domain-containing protein [Leptospira yanagawae]|nr:GyrI-like domain-containing protein [Leptospira yanagawae]